MIVITGGTGFIGSNLVAGLEDAGYSDLVVCDSFGEGDKWRNISKRELRDIVVPERLFEYLDRHQSEVKIIYHLGGITSTTANDADLIIESNFNLPCRLISWCARHGVRFIYGSSFATYGDGSAGFSDSDSPEALAKLRPLNPYGWSRHLFDRRVARMRAAGGQLPPQAVGLKFFNVYGPNEFHKGDQMSLACKLYPQMDAGAAARLFRSSHPDYKDGGQMRDFIYVRDCVDVMIWLYQHPDVSGLFNLGTGQARTFNDLAAAVFQAAGKPVKINYVDMPQVLVGRYQNFAQADMAKLRAAGYDKPFTSLEDGISDYIKTYLSAPDPYR